jgi:hypothetical protein
MSERKTYKENFEKTQIQDQENQKGGNSMSERKTYEKKLETQIQEMDAKIDQLQAKLETMEAVASKSVIQSSLDDLRSRKYALEEKVEKLTRSTDSAWDELQTGVEKAFDDMKSAVENAISKFGI